jgi:hypothetical protein
MRTTLIAAAIVVTAATAGACVKGNECDFGDCASPTADGGTEGSIAEAGGDVVQPPAGCDPAADPKDAPKCVVSEFGVFVDGTSGANSNVGTKESPVKTIAAALGKLGDKSRIYVCEGAYAEHVLLTTAVSLYGGFGCGSWGYSGTKARLAPSDNGYALRIEGVGAPIVVADLAVTAVGAVDAGASSIALFVSESAGVTLRRVSATAGKGKAIGDATAPPSNLFAGDPAGNPAAGAAGANPKTCACPSYGSSTGGGGGAGGIVGDRNGKAGMDGGAAPILPPPTGTFDGKGGQGAVDPGGGCSVGTAGASGQPRAAGAGAMTLAVVSRDGWVGSSGSDGLAGNAAQGGGGGGGDSATGGGGGGGGGGCGGCGGSGGIGGKAGGSSAAIVMFASSLHLDRVDLRTDDAGKGGNGSKGGGGGGGGGGTVGACSGRAGGNGAGGSGGGGGAGGVSAGIVRKGGSLEGTPMVTHGQKGAPGAGGDSGPGGMNTLGTAQSGNAGTVGQDGVADNLVVVD